MQEIEKIMDILEKHMFSAEVYNDDFDGTNIGNLICLGDVRTVLEDHMDGGWIPVEERMPEDEIPTPKLVTALVPDRKARWDNSETFSLIVDTDVYDPDYMGKWEYYKKNVIAWRPLPEPYRLERREGE